MGSLTGSVQDMDTLLEFYEVLKKRSIFYNSDCIGNKIDQIMVDNGQTRNLAFTMKLRE